MSQTEPLLVYVILGAAGSGRRKVLADLIEGGLEENERAVVLFSENESGVEFSAPQTQSGQWSWSDGQIHVAREGLAGATHLFWVTDGRANPVDQIEAFKSWLETSGAELARLITVVNCRLAEQHRELVEWYEACIHFSDVVLLANREGVPNKWMSDFQNRFKDQFFPCVFEFVKDGRVKNPPLILEPQARRVSHLFDETDWELVGGGDIEEEIEGEEESTEEVEVVAQEDPYLERRQGGRRVRELPDIAKFLDAPATTDGQA